MNGASLQIPRVEAENRINIQIKTGQQLLQTPITNEEALNNVEAEYRQWINDTITLLNGMIDSDDFVQTFVDSSEQDVHEIEFSHRQHQPFETRLNELSLTLADQVVRLESIAARLDLYPESLELPMYDGPRYRQNHRQESLPQQSTERRIFIAHGHDDDAKQAVARYVEQLGHAPIILEEQPNQGRTIIEKFEEYADVDYVLVLLTPDDLGTVKPVGPDNLTPDKMTYRARQNVIFELGYFFGKLGRHRVCALVKDKVEFPSDISGVLWMRMDQENNWKFSLAREMRAAGLDIDLNRLV